MTNKNIHVQFISGPIPAELIGQKTAYLKSDHRIGAQNMFLGQIRQDEINLKHVVAISYTAYQEMAMDQLQQIAERASVQFDILGLYIIHSLNDVRVGDFSLFVLAGTRHRKNAFEACVYIVDEIKARVPIWGKELLDDDTHSWKINS